MAHKISYPIIKNVGFVHVTPPHTHPVFIMRNKGRKFLAIELHIFIWTESRPGLQLSSKNSALHHYS